MILSKKALVITILLALICSVVLNVTLSARDREVNYKYFNSPENYIDYKSNEITTEFKKINGKIVFVAIEK